MKKLIFALFISLLVLTVLFTACKESDGDSDAPQNESTTVQTPQSDKNNNSESDSESKPSTEKNDTSEHIHFYGEWHVTKSASCTENGTETRYCSCGEAQTRDISSKGHEPGALKTVKNATCTEEGKKEQICNACKDILHTEIIKPLDHQYPEYGTLVSPPTCTQEGSQSIKCIRCPSSYIASIPPTNHSYKKTLVPVSCDTAGGYQYDCQYCSDNYFEKTADPTGSHNIGIDGICTNCKKNLSTNMRNKLSAPIESSSSDFSFLNDGICFHMKWQARNTSGKTIKYCTFQVVLYNAVGDRITSVNYKITGPIANGETLSVVYSGTNFKVIMALSDAKIDKMEIANIMLEYTDGSTDCGNYGYSTTTENKDLYW